jgi:hypothetical protein
MTFFTRIDGLTLTPGNKTAGFCLSVSVPAAHVLSTLAVSAEELQRVRSDALARVRNSGLLTGDAVDDCGFEFFNGSSLPRYFWVSRMFAASIGADPTDLADVANATRARDLGPELSFTPHNCDAPAHALVLMILVQAWAEWAWGRLMVAEEQLKRVEKDHER